MPRSRIRDAYYDKNAPSGLGGQGTPHHKTKIRPNRFRNPDRPKRKYKKRQG